MRQIRIIGAGVLVTLGLLLATKPMRAEQPSAKERYDLAESMERAKLSLGEGLKASESKGKPISGKFEMEDGKLQLSVYTMKNNKFSEVVVDHKTGTIAKVEPIKGGEDLTAAKSQSEAVTKAKSSLSAVIEKALKENEGYAAVSVTPSLKDGHPIAEVSLISDEGQDLKTVSEPME